MLSSQELHAQTLDAFLGALHASGLATEDLGVQLKTELAQIPASKLCACLWADVYYLNYESGAPPCTEKG